MNRHPRNRAVSLRHPAPAQLGNGALARSPGIVGSVNNTRTATANTVNNDDQTCVDKLCEVAGRDRVVAQKLRSQAATLLNLAEALEINANIGTAAAVEMLGD